jgi:hypothetical protein
VEERDVASSSASVDASSGHKSPPPHDPPGAKRELSYDSSSVFDEAPSVELNTDNDQEGSEDDSDYDSEVRSTIAWCHLQEAITPSRWLLEDMRSSPERSSGLIHLVPCRMPISRTRTMTSLPRHQSEAQPASPTATSATGGGREGRHLW